jgi:hypothetical protein
MQVNRLSFSRIDIDHQSMPSSVSWQSFRLETMDMTAARVLPLSALAALTGPFKLQAIVVSSSFSVVQMQLQESVQRLVQAEQVKCARRTGRPLLDACEFRATVHPLPAMQGQPDADHRLLASWIYTLLFLTNMSGLGLRSVSLLGLKATALADAPASSSSTLELSAAVGFAEGMPAQCCPHFMSAVQQGNSQLLTLLGALLADAFPHLTSLELNNCNISAPQLEPLLSTAPVKALKLMGGTQLGSTDTSTSLRALLTLLPNSSIDHLEVCSSLWGGQVPGGSQQHPPAPRPSIPPGDPPAQLQKLRHVVFKGCGQLHHLLPLLGLMPNLTHLKVEDDRFRVRGLTPKLLRHLLPGMPHLRTLLLPSSFIEGVFPAAVLKAQSLEHFEVITAGYTVGHHTKLPAIHLQQRMHAWLALLSAILSVLAPIPTSQSLLLGVQLSSGLVQQPLFGVSA